MPEEKNKEQDECLECKKKQKDARWRDDFPVNWESDNYVTRREMVKFLALGSLTIAGANAVLAGFPTSSKPQRCPEPGWPSPRLFPLVDRSYSPIQQKKIPAFLCVKATAIWLRIPRCALTFHVP